MKGSPACSPAPRRTLTRASPSRLGRIVSRVPSALTSISSRWRATNSASIATGVPGVGASVAAERTRTFSASGSRLE